MNRNQAAFRNNHSIYMALLNMLENVRNALDDSECEICIFLDLQKKTFGTIHHNILWCALSKIYHIYMVRCLKAFVLLLSKIQKYLIKLRNHHSLILTYVSYSIHLWVRASDMLIKHFLALQNIHVRVIADVSLRTNVDDFIKNLVSVQLERSWSLFWQQKK